LDCAPDGFPGAVGTAGTGGSAGSSGGDSGGATSPSGGGNAGSCTYSAGICSGSSSDSALCFSGGGSGGPRAAVIGDGSASSVGGAVFFAEQEDLWASPSAGASDGDVDRAFCVARQFYPGSTGEARLFLSDLLSRIVLENPATFSDAFDSAWYALKFHELHAARTPPVALAVNYEMVMSDLRDVVCSGGGVAASLATQFSVGDAVSATAAIVGSGVKESATSAAASRDVATGAGTAKQVMASE
jgi:hypothetical protein